MSVAYQNLPGVFPNLEEGGLGVANAAQGPRTLVLGTAEKGQSQWPYVVRTTSSAASEFGSEEGTLIRGMYEVKTGGAQNVILYRLGATAAKLEHVGDSTGVAGYTIETLRRDDDAGGMYSIYYDDGSDRLVIWNIITGLVVYDNDSTDPVDLGEVIVSGERAAGGGPDIAGPSAGFALEDVVSLGHAGTVYTAGQDNHSPSRMELYQFLYKAYKDLLTQEFDWVVPMDVYLNDKNIIDGDAFSAAYLTTTVLGTEFPTPSSSDDILGKLFVEEYQGDYYFFWDLDGDGLAELYPSVGAANDSTKIDGTSLNAADFHEVNFAYQLARFCHEMSTNQKFCLGGIGVRPPSSLALPDVAQWVGKLPTYTTRSDGTQYIRQFSDNGTGLLGNKFKAGSYAYRSGAAYGGFILTDTDFLDGIEETDINGYAIDVGAYISVVASIVRLFNSFDRYGTGYLSTAAPTYIGYASSLDEQIAPTNKVIRSVRRVFGINVRQVDNLAGAGYVYIYEKPKGMTISDAPTGATPTSDYRRLTTMRIVKRVVMAIRAAADPFLGNAFDATRKVALETAIDQNLSKLLQEGYIQRYTQDLRQTRRQMVIGEADLQLVIVPAWELRRITVNLALAAE